LEREPRHRYATASEMEWELLHQDQVGVYDRAGHAAGRTGSRRAKGKILIYAALVLLPLAIFAVMLLVAKR
ncbi:MAG: hypothetical protein WBF42_07610, partial [Terracidiphilus sp.]